MAATRYVAFLRGINVSGHKIIKMEDLRSMFALPGISDVKTYIQSGNVLFSSTQSDESKLTKKLEDHLEKQLSYRVAIILRTMDQLMATIEQNPFTPETLPAGDNRKLSVTFLQTTPDPSKVQDLPTQFGPDELKVVGRDVYIIYKAYSDSKLSNALIEKKLGVAATTRNWATINKMTKLYPNV